MKTKKACDAFNALLSAAFVLVNILALYSQIIGRKGLTLCMLLETVYHGPSLATEKCETRSWAWNIVAFLWWLSTSPMKLHYIVFAINNRYMVIAGMVITIRSISRSLFESFWVRQRTHQSPFNFWLHLHAFYYTMEVTPFFNLLNWDSLTSFSTSRK